MSKDQAKKVLKLALVLYVASFLIINWNDVSWVFNYKEVYGLVSDFFNPYPSIDATSIDAYFYPNHSQNSTTAAPAKITAQTVYTEKQNTLEIPKISISVPIVFATSTVKADLMKNLDQGAVYYPGSVYPGQTGQIIILGHSAPPGWPTIKHDWIFSQLDKLSEGDKISIDMNNVQYTYVVIKKTIINRGSDIPQDGLDASKNVLTLISCWPPGKDYQRITVQAELQTS